MGNTQTKPVDMSGEVNLNHFRLLRVVGRGAFGKVRIVERKDTNLSFALKYIRKDEVVKSESARNIIRERRMLEHVNHPFICNLRYSFQDIEYMYLVVDLMTGGDLRFHISRKTFTEEAVRFWIAELGCALRYVHGQGILHRDVKPDNVLLDGEGHVHLTDFNVASDIIRGKVLTSKSGTLAYLAPEVYAGTGYNTVADWWSLGVTFYECIYNKRPFEGNSETTLSTAIQNVGPKYPITSPPVSLPCVYAISSALEPNATKRMGVTWESFIHHEFFAGIDFDALERKEIEPVFIPSSEKTNFDASYDLEELLLEEAPLEARARRAKPRVRLKDDATDKEIREEELYRVIEREFCNFDYTLAAYKKIAEHCSNFENAQPQAVTTDEAIPLDANGSTASPRKSLSLGTASAGTEAGSMQGGDSSTRPVPRTAPTSQPEARPRPAPLSPYHQSNYANRVPGANAARIVSSPTGGMQVTLDGTGSWSDLARQDGTLSVEANTAAAASEKSEGNGGVLGFFRSRRGRGHSPKPRERGVLGKEGARVVIG